MAKQFNSMTPQELQALDAASGEHFVTLELLPTSRIANQGMSDVATEMLKGIAARLMDQSRTEGEN